MRVLKSLLVLYVLAYRLDGRMIRYQVYILYRTKPYLNLHFISLLLSSIYTIPWHMILSLVARSKSGRWEKKGPSKPFMDPVSTLPLPPMCHIFYIFWKTQTWRNGTKDRPNFVYIIIIPTGTSLYVQVVMSDIWRDRVGHGCLCRFLSHHCWLCTLNRCLFLVHFVLPYTRTLLYQNVQNSLLESRSSPRHHRLVLGDDTTDSSTGNSKSADSPGAALFWYTTSALMIGWLLGALTVVTHPPRK